ncbi:MAG: alcohol dehydrogenase [Chlamydiae bacterium]|nr:alcohol dehydrogenase [Chlamydiota bacterium]
MKAIVLTTGTDNVSLEEWPEPELQTDDDVKLKVLQVGICGTDREEACGGRADAPQGEKRLIIGHEMLGQVVACGKNVIDFKKGDLALFTVRRGCERCIACEKGFYDMCYTGNYKERGIKNLHGFQSEFVVDKEKYLVKIPSSLRSVAVLTEPTTVVEKAIDEICRIQTSRLPCYRDHRDWLDGKLALVAGLGPIGLLATMVLRLHGCHVLGLDVVDDNSPRPQILKGFGGTYIHGKKVSLQDLSKHYPQIDLIVEAAGIAKLDFDLITTLGTNGIYALTGVPAEGSPLSIPGASLMKQLVLKNQVILGSVNANFTHFKQAVVDLEKGMQMWSDLLPKIISHHIPYTQFHKALSEHHQDEIKVVIEWQP